MKFTNFWIGFLAIWSVLATPYLGWEAYQAYVGKEPTGYVIYGIAAFLCLYSGLGLFFRANLARQIFLGFCWLSLAGDAIGLISLVVVIASSEGEKLSVESLNFGISRKVSWSCN